MILPAWHDAEIATLKTPWRILLAWHEARITPKSIAALKAAWRI